MKIFFCKNTKTIQMWTARADVEHIKFCFIDDGTGHICDLFQGHGYGHRCICGFVWSGELLQGEKP